MVSVTAIPEVIFGPALAADAVSGTWGPVQADGSTKCEGLAVLVFHEGRYFRVLPNVGSTGGNNQYVLSKSTYRVSGDEVVVKPPCCRVWLAGGGQIIWC